MNYYYHPKPESNFVLNSEESSHAIKVLRKTQGDQIHLMDGNGYSYLAEITNDNFRKCSFKILSKRKHEKKSFSIHVAIAPTKNIDRIEWFVEKVCELGIDEISLIETKRTERTKVKIERLEKKAISAMKQSKNFWKCKINAVQKFNSFLQSKPASTQNFIAFVETGKEESLKKMVTASEKYLVLIGPEGDFTLEEIQHAKTHGFETINLGNNVLRTETAGIIAVHTLNLMNE
ncbi:MAG: 16S rRNA (uracil(1498)-N(3))-methyltransferase [Reichenbachiella sp.]